MEETATQPATQPQDGTSGLKFSISEQDQTDVICILHPTSVTAHRAVDLVVRQCPQHILQNEGLEDLLYYDDAELEPAGSTRPDLGSQGSQENDKIEEKPTDEAGIPSNYSARDIALRISSRLVNPCLGFTFGRIPRKCDIPVVRADNFRISASHFRIYINQGGVLMLEDTSTNGTWVDHLELNAKSTKPNIGRRCIITQGNIISLPNGDEPIRFIVGFPGRNGQNAAYAKALEEYSAYTKQLERQAALAAQAAADGNPMPPPVRINTSVALDNWLTQSSCSQQPTNNFRDAWVHSPPHSLGPALPFIIMVCVGMVANCTMLLPKLARELLLLSTSCLRGRMVISSPPRKSRSVGISRMGF